MRRHTGRWLAAALAMMLAALACVDDNPFVASPDNVWQGGDSHPAIVMWGTASGGMGTTELNDTDPGTVGLQDALLLVFDQSMSPATMVVASLDLVATTTGGADPEIEQVDYYPSAARLEIQATFEEETAYLLTLPAGGATDLAGNPLDPNHNAQEDGSPWDDARLAFHSGSALEMDLVPPFVAAHQPAEQGGITDPATPIVISFAEGPMDATGITTETLSLLTTQDSSEVEIAISSVTPQQVVAEPRSPLQAGTRYTVVLSAEVADTTGNLLDSNADGFIWPDEADFTWDFQMADDSTTNATPPTVAQAELVTDQSIRIQFRESLTGARVSMDASTLTPAHIQCIDSAGQIPVQVGEPGPAGDDVICYLLRPFQGEVTVVVTIGARDEFGNPLDGNGNGLGGEPGIDDWTGTI